MTTLSNYSRKRSAITSDFDFSVTASSAEFSGDGSGMSCMTDRSRKRPRISMEENVKHDCLTLLKKLMAQAGVKAKPVDPVALGITDYEHKIKLTNLGLMRYRLEKGFYSGPDEFASDVRLIFYNALVCNPSFDGLRKTTMEVASVFENGWQRLERKWCHEKETEKAEFEEASEVISDVKRRRLERIPLFERLVKVPSDSEKRKNMKASERKAPKGVNKAPNNYNGKAKRTPLADDEDKFHADSVCDSNGYSNGPSSSSDITSGETKYGPEMSSRRAKRVEMLRSRFAETISKANAVLNGSGNEAALKLKFELKKEREKQREAARLAIEKIVKTVEFGDSEATQKEFELLVGDTKAILLPCLLFRRDHNGL